MFIYIAHYLFNIPDNVLENGLIYLGAMTKYTQPAWLVLHGDDDHVYVSG